MNYLIGVTLAAMGVVFALPPRPGANWRWNSDSRHQGRPTPIGGTRPQRTSVHPFESRPPCLLTRRPSKTSSLV